MAYSELDIRRVLDATDIVALIGGTVALKRVGRRYVGLCPFHQERSASFSVNGEDGIYYCFGCHAKGDAITFVRETQGVDFVEALEYLADRAHVVIEASARVPADRNAKARLYDGYERLTQWYQAQLVDPLRGEVARAYLGERGIGAEAIRLFGLGFSPSRVQLPIARLGIEPHDWEEGGFGYRDQHGSLVDHMHGRVVFPIRDTTGRVVAFGGRILPQELERLEGKAPKYKNSSESPIYRKRRTLYNLDRARAAIVDAGVAIVCEGYTDVIALDGIGVHNVVATCGTAFSEEHLDVLCRFARKVTLFFDADAAGQSAAERLWSEEESRGVTFDVAQLPEGLDPAEATKKDPELVRYALGRAVPITRFRLERLLAGGDLASVEDRSRVARSALAMIERHPNHLIRGEYVAMIADSTGFSVGELMAQLPKGVRSKTFVEPVGSVTVVDRPAVEALRLLVHDTVGLDGIVVPELFRDPRYRQMVEWISGASSLHQAQQRLQDLGSETLLELFFQLASERSESEHSADVIATLVLRESKLELERLTRSLHSSSSDLTSLIAEVPRVRLLIEELQSDRSQMEPCGALIGWLVGMRSKPLLEPAVSEGSFVHAPSGADGEVGNGH
ncbi:MAG: DNA primase [Ferrimicrobium sp.]|uniref:DNA primase n=2 Tax=Ferrimicrobium TaxID=121038 RepID=A0ABV3Y445_9ACTN|nr:DNA primase [Actinomycetota bacterium]